MCNNTFVIFKVKTADIQISDVCGYLVHHAVFCMQTYIILILFNALILVLYSDCF